MRYERKEEQGKYINPNNRIIGRTTDADFFLITNQNAPQAARYEIRSKGKSVALSLSNSTIDAAITDLKTWAKNHNRVLLTYYQHQTKQ